MPSKLAILIPAYNCQSTVRETLCSLQRIDEGWQHVERVAICDDASSDGTWSILQSSGFDKCPLTLLRHHKNQGEAACYDTMLAALPDKTQWFLVLHSDDIALENFIQRNVEILDRCGPKVAAVSSNYYEFGNGEERLAHAPAEDRIVFRADSQADLMHTALTGSWWHISGSLINRKLWESFGGRNPAFPQVGDWDLILRWQRVGYVVGHSLIPTTKYRSNLVGSLSSQSYLKFRDLQERTQVILGLPDIFTGQTRRTLAMRLGISALRRVCKFLAAGRLGYAARGTLILSGCVWSLLKGAPSSPSAMPSSSKA